MKWMRTHKKSWIAGLLAVILTSLYPCAFIYALQGLGIGRCLIAPLPKYVILRESAVLTVIPPVILSAKLWIFLFRIRCPLRAGGRVLREIVLLKHIFLHRAGLLHRIAAHGAELYALRQLIPTFSAKTSHLFIAPSSWFGQYRTNRQELLTRAFRQTHLYSVAFVSLPITFQVIAPNSYSVNASIPIAVPASACTQAYIIIQNSAPLCNVISPEIPEDSP